MNPDSAPTTDPLTGLPSRDAFLDVLARVIRDADTREAGVALAVFDIDLFGEVNTRHGRDAGDALLRGLARGLMAGFGGGHRVFRYGGDALSVVFPGQSKELAFLEAERFRTDLAEGRVTGITPSGVTVSAGVAASPDDGDDPQVLANKANEALYRAKVSGRNQVCLAREERMVTKTSHYTMGQLMGLRRLAERKGVKDAELLREALTDLLLKHNA